MRDVLKLSLRLLAFCVAAGLLLAATNAITKEPIARQAEITAQNARKQVLTEAASFNLLTDEPGAQYPHLAAVYEGVDSSGTVGYTFSLAPMGFKATIEMTLGVNKKGAITALSVDSQSETAGLGNRITTAAYLDQYPGVAATEEAVAARIDGITGATVTSKAVIGAVTEAVAYAHNELGIEGAEDKSLSGSKYLTEEELRRVSLIDGGRTIASLAPYDALGYSSIASVYQVAVRDSLAYVMVLDVEGTEYEAAFDEKGSLSVTLAGEAAEVPASGALSDAVAQATEFYETYLKEAGDNE